MPKRMELLTQFWIAFWLVFCPILEGQSSLRESRGSEVLATIERSGGFAGVHDEFTIFRNGEVTDTSGSTRRIPAAELNSIMARMEALDIPKSCRIGLPEGYCWDCLRYVITLRYPSGHRTICLNETQMGGDDGVSALARNLRDIISRIPGAPAPHRKK